MLGNICVIGLGYIGIPTSIVFADSGYKVLGVDINEDIVKNFNEGNLLINEPNIDKIFKSLIKEERLRADLVPKDSDIFIIAVPTPINENKEADMSYVKKALLSILPVIKKGNVIIIESTCPVGTMDEIIIPILSKLDVYDDIYIGYCPERVIPGNVLYEIKNNYRVIGGVNQKSSLKIKEIYKTFVNGEIYITDCKVAEMCKLAENTYRDVNIALSNEIMKICDKENINVWEVIKYSNMHPRVNFHTPGPGVGGHCIAVDPWFIINRNNNLANIIKLSRDINDSMPYYVFDKLNNILDTTTKNDLKITILGITYKANTDDMRESPILKLKDILTQNNFNVSIYDPYIKDENAGYNNIYDACRECDVLILGVNHNLFCDIDFKKLKNIMNGNIILDTRNFLDKKYLESIGFKYMLIGDI